MKAKTIAIAFLIAICGAGKSLAHGPSYIRLSYNPASENLEIMVAHEVGDEVGENSGHYVNRISVILNHEEVDSMMSEGQPGDVFTIDYPVGNIDVRHILVIAYCNRYGSIKEELNLEQSGLFTNDEYQDGDGYREWEPPINTVPRDIRAPSTMGSRDLDPGFGENGGLYDAQSMEPGFEFEMNDDFYD